MKAIRSEAGLLPRILPIAAAAFMALALVAVALAEGAKQPRILSFECESPAAQLSVNQGTALADAGLPAELRAVVALEPEGEGRADAGEDAGAGTGEEPLAFTPAEPTAQQLEESGYVAADVSDGSALAPWAYLAADGTKQARAFGSFGSEEPAWYAVGTDGKPVGKVEAVPVSWEGDYDAQEPGSYALEAVLVGYAYAGPRPWAVAEVAEGGGADEAPGDAPDAQAGPDSGNAPDGESDAHDKPGSDGASEAGDGTDSDDAANGESADGAAVFSADAGDGVIVSVEAPEGHLPCPASELTLTAAPVDSAEAEELVQAEAGAPDEGKRRETKVYDLKLMRGSEEVQPTGPVKVSFDGTGAQGDDVQLFHLDEDMTEADDLEAVVSEGGIVEASTQGFSPYAVTWTVDFHFGGLSFSIEGESSILLSEVFSRLSIDRSAADVVSCEFSDPTLVAVEQTDGDWLLTSLVAFDTKETLTCTFENGDVIVIDVTDARYVRGGTASTFMGSIPFSTTGVNYSALNTTGSNVQFSTTNGTNFRFGSIRPNENYSSPQRSLYIAGSFANNRTTTIPGSATLTFRNAATLADGSTGDVQLVFSSVTIRPRGSRVTHAALYSGNTLFAYGWNGGRAVRYTHVTMNVTMSVVGGSGNRTFTWACRDLDQSDYTTTNHHGNYAGPYAESFRVNGGSIVPAYVTQANWLRITSNGDTTNTANGLKFTATRLDNESFNSGFATQFSTTASLSWWGAFCGTQIGTSVLSLGYSPHYRTYLANGGLSGYAVGNRGGDTSVYDPINGASHSWRESSVRYSYLWFGNGKSATVRALPATGYYLASATRNGSYVSMPGNSLGLTNLQVNTNIDAYFSPIRGSITIKKTDAATGEPLTGAVFTATGTSSIHGSFSLTSVDNGDGTYTIANLPYGRSTDIYTISETQAPPNYSLAPDQTVRGDAFASNGAVVTLSFKDSSSLAAPFSFVKVDKDGAPLAGATFELYACPAGSDYTQWPLASDASEAAGCWVVSSPFRTATSGSDGVVDLGELPPGPYMLAETAAPPGCALPGGQWLLEVDPQANPPVTITAHASPGGDLPPAFKLDQGSGVLQLPNYPNPVMPKAGSRSALLSSAAGAALVVVAAGLAFARRRPPRRGRPS